MRLILLGAPGAGKGTQAEILSRELSIPTISTGNILRAAIREGTAVGLKAKALIDAGKLVDDETIMGIVSERLAKDDCQNGYILDGVPRTIPQAEAMEQMGIEIDAALSIEIADETIIERMSGRRTCKNCSQTFHIVFNPPKSEGVCDFCGGELTIRKDDAPETVKARLDTFHRETEPLKALIMRQAAKITAGARSMGRQAVRDGLTTKQIDRAVHEYIVKCGAFPSCLGYEGFPAATCVSVNDEVIHGIPGKRIVRNGDIVSIDLCATYKGFVGDCAGTYPVGEVSEEAKKLIEVTRQAFFEGIRFAKVGYRIYDIGQAVQDYVESHGFSVVRDFVGHGIGRGMHEAPEVPNYRPSERRPNPRLLKGMTICVEPMVCAGDWRVKILKDGWTVVTADHSLAAHYENTILITDGEPEILTMADDI